MKIVILLLDDDLFVEGSFTSAYGPHSKRLTEDLPQSVRNAARRVGTWANGAEADLVHDVERARTRDELTRDIARLQAQLDATRA